MTRNPLTTLTWQLSCQLRERKGLKSTYILIFHLFCSLKLILDQRWVKLFSVFLLQGQKEPTFPQEANYKLASGKVAFVGRNQCLGCCWYFLFTVMAETWTQKSLLICAWSLGKSWGPRLQTSSTIIFVMMTSHHRKSFIISCWCKGGRN